MLSNPKEKILSKTKRKKCCQNLNEIMFTKPKRKNVVKNQMREEMEIAFSIAQKCD